MAWLTWQEVKIKSANKNIIYYGRSEDWIPKCEAYISANLILDSDISYDGSTYLEIPVVRKDLYEHETSKSFIIITNSDIENVGNELTDQGLVPGEDFCYCPEFYDFRKLIDIRDQKFKIVFSSPDYLSGKATRTSKLGGGIYQFEYDGNQSKIKKYRDGQYRQIDYYNGKLYAVQYNEHRIDVFDEAFDVVESFQLPRAHFCGLKVLGDKQFIVANASTDQIHLLNFDSNQHKTIDFGVLSSNAGESRYHINDVEVYKDTIFVSYFSKSGFWKHDVFDGGVAAFDLNRNCLGDLFSGLWQPHSPRIFDGKLHVLDSSGGQFIRGSHGVRHKFQGFIRGLDSCSGYHFIGQSETMYVSRKVNTSTHINNTSGIYIFDTTVNSSRFYPTYGICNIHDLRVIST